MTDRQHGRVTRRKVARYTPVLVALLLAVAFGEVFSQYAAGLKWPGFFASAVLLSVLGRDVGEVIVARYDL